VGSGELTAEIELSKIGASIFLTFLKVFWLKMDWWLCTTCLLHGPHHRPQHSNK